MNKNTVFLNMIMLSRFPKYLTISLAFTTCLVLIGCAGPETTFPLKPAHSISVDQLASQLGLSARQINKTHYELTNTNNRVLLFMYENGRVYVNGNTIGSVGPVREYDGTHYVQKILLPRIRQHLVTSYIPKPEPIPDLRFASGTVVIDPGHGGKDPGAQSVLGYWEKNVNLEISYKVAGYLRQSGVDVVMTREGDSYPELEERAALANRINADLFVSIHCNTIADSSYQGFILFTARSSSWTSKKTARNLKNSLSAAGIPGRGIQNQDFRVLVQTKCPAVLVECGFISNYDEATQLANSWYQNKLARAVADGIIKSL